MGHPQPWRKRLQDDMAQHPPRILIAKAGLDGHDRGALLVCLALRDAGCEVLYTGIRNTPAQITAAAIQEDVDGVGLSSLSGAHKALFPRVAEELRAAGGGDIALFAGGIFPMDDREFLQKAGIRRLFHPGTAMKEICDYCIQAAQERRKQAHSANGSSLYGLSAKLTKIESEQSISSTPSTPTDQRIIGITGPGGTGKSTMIDALIGEAVRRGEKVGVLCVDPSSIRSGGAFLGDRIRMQRHAAAPGVFVRSVATRGAAGGSGRRHAGGPGKIGRIRQGGRGDVARDAPGRGRSGARRQRRTGHGRRGVAGPAKELRVPVNLEDSTERWGSAQIACADQAF
ncbi:cobalamin B12-binding domain-containing protein [Candidatus Sumerlaeota bacterium]|nr:cobalamin B12-binding domain-containing protein [Candidatus Sumerlaeota bacterium]